MTTPTSKAIPSDQPADLLFNAERIDEVVNSTEETFVDRFSRVRRTLAGVMTSILGNSEVQFQEIEAAALAQRATIRAAANTVLSQTGYAPPVGYTAGLVMAAQTQTVEYVGQAYAPKVSALPFTTSGAFEVEKFRLIQGVASVDLAAGTGSLLVGHLDSNEATSISAQAHLRARAPTPENYRRSGDTDDTAAIQRALDVRGACVLSPGQTYTVSPQALSTPDGGTGICINLHDGCVLDLGNATVRQKAGTGGSGAVIGNNAPISGARIIGRGAVVDGNNSATTGDMCTVVLFNSKECRIEGIRPQNSRFILAGFRANNFGYGRNSMRDVVGNGSLYIGLSANKQDLGLDLDGVTMLYTGDNAFDIEGNNSAGNGVGSNINLRGLVAAYCSVALYLESVGNTNLANFYFSQFSTEGIRLNRINSGAFDVNIHNGQLRDGVDAPGIRGVNTVGRVNVGGVIFNTLLYATDWQVGSAYVNIGDDCSYENITGGVRHHIPRSSSAQLFGSRIHGGLALGARASNGAPFSCSPLTNAFNFSGRAINVKASGDFFADNGVEFSSADDEYKTSKTGTLQAFGTPTPAFSKYQSGQTYVLTNGAAVDVVTSGYYLLINSALYKATTAPGGAGYVTLANASGVDGDYTAALNSGFGWTELFPAWQTT